ncbi:retropepsin-like aspartic protease family protein [Sphingomonas sp. Tas61C01]|uniref:retropepsin-like aspartic protease family protein n=1 Tax=Sphingomonas sp. Tas61C01 TaxID=3458297 RepID=UPI00403E9D38
MLNILKPLTPAIVAIIGFVSPSGGEQPARVTPAVIAPAVEASSDNVTRAHKEADGLFYVIAHVNGTPIRFVVDTGANVVVLTGSDARRAGVTSGVGSERIETAAGGSTMRWAMLDRVDLAGKRLTATRAAVVEDGLKISLLGQNALSQMKSVTLVGERLELR